jgi:RNA polymerase sigma-70 factor (ECF subfamily)
MDTRFADMVKDAFKLAAKIVNNNSDAHDVIQDAATIALNHEKAPKLDADNFKPWFYRVVRNRSIDKLRSIQREQKRAASNEEEAIDNISSQAAHTLNPEYQLVKQQQHTALNQALISISVQQREIVLLKDYHDFSYLQIAEILDIAPGSVMSRLHRSRNALKEALLKQVKEDKHHDEH